MKPISFSIIIPFYKLDRNYLFPFGVITDYDKGKFPIIIVGYKLEISKHLIT